MEIHFTITFLARRATAIEVYNNVNMEQQRRVNAARHIFTPKFSNIRKLQVGKFVPVEWHHTLWA